MNFISALLLALCILCLCSCLGGGALILMRLTGNFVIKGRRKGNPAHRGKDNAERKNKASFMRRGLFSEGTDKAQKLNGADALIIGELIMIGLAVTAHGAAVFTRQSFSDCVTLFSGLLVVLLLPAAVLLIIQGISHAKSQGVFQKNKADSSLPDKAKRTDIVERIFAGIFAVLVLGQLIFIFGNAGVYTQGDMTVETVAAFLETDGIYLVNPMTGQAYTAGMPSRIKILCLPSLYGIFCSWSGLEPDIVVSEAVPALILISSYAAFSCIGRSLFTENRRNRYCFLIVTALLMWAGSYLYGMDGFQLLYCGYRGVTIRNLILIPYLVSLCLRKRWKSTVLCILAEAGIVWTFYGMGACILTAAGLFAAGRQTLNDKQKKK